jgi:hypothetical protein
MAYITTPEHGTQIAVNHSRRYIMKTFAFTALIFLSSVINSFGARQDNSMTLVYVFLGMCGMIIFLQIIPLLILVYGSFKAMFTVGKVKVK